MAQFDLHPYEEGWLLDVQADLLDGLNTRAVVPLLPIEAAPKPARRLNPVFTLRDRKFVMVTQFLAAVPVVELGEAAGSLGHERDAIKAAVDMLFDGI